MPENEVRVTNLDEIAFSLPLPDTGDIERKLDRVIKLLEAIERLLRTK